MTVTNEGGSVTFVVPAAPSGTPYCVELKFSPANVVVEPRPRPKPMVEYL